MALISRCLVFSLLTLLAAFSLATSDLEIVGCEVLANVPPFPGHMIPVLRLGEELRRRGYKVCVSMLVFAGGHPQRVVTDRGLPLIAAEANESYTEMDAGFTEERNQVAGLWFLLSRLRVLDGKVYHRLLRSPAAFLDPSTGKQTLRLIISDVFSLWSSYLISHKYADVPFLANIPSVNTIPTQHPPWPHPLVSLPLSKEMTFMQRLQNEAIDKLSQLIFTVGSYLLKPVERQSYGVELPDMVPGEDFPLIVDVPFGLDYAVADNALVLRAGPLLPSDKEPIPEELKAWIASQQERIVVVGFGSAVHLSMRTGSQLLRAIADSGRPTLWALKDSNREFLDPDSLPANLRLDPWLPQLAVLQQEYIGVFIGHCGNGGAQEALLNGVPLICLPWGRDQPGLAARFMTAGVGVTLDLHRLEAKELVAALEDVLGRNSSSYQAAVERVRRTMGFAGGLTRAADFSELVMEIGYEHLVMEKRRMSFVARNKLEIYGALTGVVVMVVVAVQSVWKRNGGHSKTKSS